MFTAAHHPALQSPLLYPAHVAVNYDFRLPADERRAGGDFCVCDRQSDGTLWSVLGDVSAKGKRGLVLARSLVAAFHLESVFARHPSTMLRQLNLAMLSFVTRHNYEGYFSTALVCCFRPQQGYVEYASAGSEPPMIASRAGVWTQCLTGDIVLGVETDADYTDVVVPFGPGSTMVAFTDGVSESKVAPGRENEVGSVNVARAVDDSVLKFGSPTAGKILAYVDALNASRYEDDATLFVASAVA